MTVRADSGVASILILKTIQNGIRGCFISHPQKNSSKQFNPRGRMTIRADLGVASILIPKKTIQNSSFKTKLGVASFLIPKSFHI
jgi:hypothetical protein